MENTTKYAGYGLLSASLIIFTILVMTGNHVNLIPIDQALCPPDLAMAADGTCGIYEGKKVSTGFMIAVGVGFAGFVSMAYSYMLSKKSVA